jgi:hypothetical protein
MMPEKREAFIEENKKKHATACENRKLKQEHRREMLKAGREFVRKNSVLMFSGQIGEYGLTAGALLQTVRVEHEEHIVYKVAYAFRSSKDAPNFRTGCGYIGWRLEGAHPYTFTINLTKSGALIPERLAQLIRLHVEMDIASKRVHVTPRLHQSVLEGRLYNTLSPSPKIPKTSRKILKKATKVPHVS